MLHRFKRSRLSQPRLPDPPPPPEPAMELLLAGADGPDGTPVDVAVRDGRIAAVGPPGTLPAARESLDVREHLVLAGVAEPHAHLDKTLTVGRAANPTGDLAGALHAWHAIRASVTREDLARRAYNAALVYLSFGATAVRSHIEIDPEVGLHSLEVLGEVRRRIDDLLTLQLVAMPTPPAPLTGRAGANQRALLRDALQAGADVVGGCPWMDPDPAAYHEVCIELAAEYDRPVDLHTDETTDPSVLWLDHLAELVLRSGFPQPVTASHCVSLANQPPEVAHRVADRVAAANIRVVCCPATNLYLHGRSQHAPPRALTALRALLDAGVVVAGGGDNLRDPFYPVGDGDPLTTADLLVAAGHLTVPEAHTAITQAARTAMGLEPITLQPGRPADLVIVSSGLITDSAFAGTHERQVLRGGESVTYTTVSQWIGAPSRSSAQPAPSAPVPS